MKKNKGGLTTKYRRRLNRYDILAIGDNEKLVAAHSDGSNIRFYVKHELIDAAHINTGHKRTRVMEAELKKKYCNITRQVI